MFTQNNYCSIFNAYRVKFKKKTVDVRKYFNLPLCSKNKCVSYQMYMCDSIAEMRVYNFLYLRNICVYEKENYEGDLSNYVDDGRFFCEKKQKWIIIEVFGDNRGNYEERKNKKLNYWKNNKNENLELLSLSYEDTTKKNTLIKLFEPYIGIIEENKLSEDFLEEMKKLNYHNASIIRRNKIIKECMEIKKNEPDGFLPAISQLPSHIRNYISNVSFDGGINEFRKLLGEDIDEAKKLVKKKGIDKMKKTKKNWSIQQKQAAIENHKKSHYSNKSKNQKIIICKKMSDAAKKRFSNPTNNPIYGKKGKDNPNFGKKYGSYDYKKRFLPLFAKLLVELDKNAENNIIFITESIWQKHAKTIKGCPEKPYRNPSEYNPWKETEFDGFFNDTKQYIKEKNIIINSRLMNVKNTRWAKLHYKRRKQVIDFIKENKRLPLRKENSTLYEWFRLLTTRPRSEEPYIKEGVEAINIVIKKFIK